MIVNTIECVINTQYGGFSLDQEMADWLVKEKGWTLGTDADYLSKEHKIFGGKHWISSTKHMDDKIRFDPDFIECVRALHDKYIGLTYQGKNELYERGLHLKVLDMKVVKLDIHVEIEDYHDGKEKVTAYAN